MFKFMSSVKAYMLFRPKIENPNIPAPRAENIARFFITDGQSMMMSGIRALPVNSVTMRVKVFC